MTVNLSLSCIGVIYVNKVTEFNIELQNTNSCEKKFANSNPYTITRLVNMMYLVIH